MNSILLLPGRVVAETAEEAKELITHRAASKGLKIIGPIKPYPCNVQHLKTDIWWEFYVQVEEE